MYYISDGKVYIRDGSGYRRVGITAKNKVIVTRELESVTVVPGSSKVKKLKDPVPATLDEVLRKFNVSEDRPVPAEDCPVQAED